MDIKFLIFILILIVIVILFSHKTNEDDFFKDFPIKKDYGTNFEYSCGRIIYRTDNDYEYKIIPFCCKQCKISAMNEVLNIKKLEKCNILPKIWDMYIIENYSVLDFPKHYLVIKREKTIPLAANQNKIIKWQDFEIFLNKLKYLKQNNLIITNLTIGNLFYNNRFGIIEPDVGKYNYSNIYTPKYSCLKRLNPDIFDNSLAYKNWLLKN